MNEFENLHLSKHEGEPNNPNEAVIGYDPTKAAEENFHNGLNLWATIAKKIIIRHSNSKIFFNGDLIKFCKLKISSILLT